MVDGKSICLVGASSSLDVEVRALRLAADLVECLSGDGRVVLCSDSRSVLEALRLPMDRERPDITSLRLGLIRLGRKVVLRWAPGHCGLPGNEMMDRMAKAAASVGATIGFEGVPVTIVGIAQR